MRDIGDQVVPDGVAGRVEGRVGLDVGAEVEGADGEGDDGGVALRDEFVSAEAFDVEEEGGGEGVQQAVAREGVEVVVGVQAVVFGQQGCEGDLFGDC